MIKNLITINSVDYTEVKQANVKKVVSDFNTTSSFIVEFDNIDGRYKDTFSLNEDVLIKADITSGTPTTKIFRGIIEDIKFTGSESKEVIQLIGRDYGAILQDIIAQPRIFKNTEASEIVKSLMRQNVEGITTNNVNITSTTVQKITFNGLSIFDCLKKLSEISGFFFYVDEDKDLNFKEKETVSSGEKIGSVTMSDPLRHYKLNDDAASTTVDDSSGGEDLTASVNTDVMSQTGKIDKALYFNGIVSGDTYLKGHWLFENDLTDEEGNFNGSDKGSISYTTGKIGNCIYCDGTSTGGINLPDDTMDGFSDFTIACWINRETNTGINQTISTHSFNYAGDLGILLRIRTDPSDNLYIYFGNDTYDFDYVVPYGEWVHLAVSHTGDQTSLYVNGVFEETITTENLVTGGTVDEIGVEHINYFKGKIDDYRLYNKALSSGEVNAIYSDGDGSQTTYELNGSSIVTTDATQPNRSYAFWYNQNSAPSGERLFRISGTYLFINSSGKVRMSFYNGSSYSYTGSTTAGSNDEWNHCVLTTEEDGSDTIVKIYINGELDINTTLSGNKGGTATSIQIGYSDSLDWFRGLLDDFRIYDEVLTIDEVRAIYDRSYGTEEQNPVYDYNVLSSSFVRSDEDIFNEVKVVGDRQLTAAQQIFTTGVDNTGSVYKLDSKPYNTKVTLSGTTNLIYQPGGIKFVNDPGTEDVKYLVDFPSSEITLTSGTAAGDNTIPAGSILIVDYDQSTPLIKTLRDNTSVSTYGLKNKEIIDKNIKDLDEATEVATAFIAKNKDPATRGDVKIKGILNLVPGETVIVNIPDQNQNSEEYSIIKCSYDLNKRNNLNESALNLTVSKKINSMVDLFGQHELRLRALETSEVESSITNVELYTGSIGISGLCQVISRSIGSGFYFNVDGHDVLDSPTSLLGDVRAGSEVINL